MRSITVQDPSKHGKRLCEQLAAEYLLRKRIQPSSSLSFHDALVAYIDSKKNVLSPTTLQAYQSLLHNAFGLIDSVPVSKITQNDVQMWVNQFALSHSPKTCKNAHALLCACLSVYAPDLRIRTKLPQAKAPALYTPSTEDVHALLKETEGTELEKAILLSAFGTLRLGEILALTDEDIEGNVIHVTKSLARGANGKQIIKQPKNTSSVRLVEYPPEVIARFDGIKGRLVNLTHGNVSRSLHRAQERCGIPPFRFHDLRAYSASIMHAKGIPDVYIMERGGWRTDHTLKAVYRRTIEPESKKYSDMINAYFSDVLHE